MANANKKTANNATELRKILNENRNGAFIFYPSAPESKIGKDGYEAFKDGKRTKAVKFPLTVTIE